MLVLVAVEVKLGVADNVAVTVDVAVAIAVFVDVIVRVLVEVNVNILVKVGVAVLVGVDVDVLVKVGVTGMGMIWIASTLALSTLAGPKVMVMTPPEGAMLLKTSSMALLGPPAVVKMSKLVSTVAPLMETLKTLCPAAVQ